MTRAACKTSKSWPWWTRMLTARSASLQGAQSPSVMRPRQDPRIRQQSPSQGDRVVKMQTTLITCARCLFALIKWDGVGDANAAGVAPPGGAGWRCDRNGWPRHRSAISQTGAGENLRHPEFRFRIQPTTFPRQKRWRVPLGPDTSDS
jgi:hypothetical protein